MNEKVIIPCGSSSNEESTDNIELNETANAIRLKFDIAPFENIDQEKKTAIDTPEEQNEGEYNMHSTY